MAVDSQRFLTHGAKGDKNVALNVAYKPTERQQIIFNIIKNKETDNVALNVALNTKYLSDKIGVSRKTIQKSDESQGQFINTKMPHRQSSNC